MSKITPCLWFDGTAEEAANFYAALLPDSRVDAVHRAPSDYPSGKAGDVLMVEFTLMGQPFTGLNGGRSSSSMRRSRSRSSRDAGRGRPPERRAICRAGGRAVRLGQGSLWPLLADCAAPALTRLIGCADPARAKRAFDAMMRMKRIDIAALERAADGLVKST